jgi:hypothetical protein
MARDVHQPAERDAVAVQTRAMPVRARLAVHGDARQDDAWIDRGQGVVTEAPLLERPGPEVLDDDVGLAHQPLQQVLAARLPEIERDGTPAAPLDRPEERVPVHERPDGAHEVALPRHRDLDHVRAEVTEQRRRERRADAGAQVEDANAGERSVHAGRMLPEPPAPVKRFRGDSG